VIDDDAAPPRTDDRLRPRGSNQGGMRQFNERVVLQAIRLHERCPKAEIARLTHLTPQTVQLIIGRLEADDLVLRCEPVRGKVGQPSVPMALNPDGAFSIGITVGRRRMEMLLMDFRGDVRERLAHDYAFPDPATLFDEIAAGLKRLRATLKPALRSRLCGIGVAAPLRLEGWAELLGIDAATAKRWIDTDVAERVRALGGGLPVELVKDTTAACVAELVAGRGRALGSFLYLFVDTFIGGGLVIDSHLVGGATGNAGAVGSLPLLPAKAGARPPGQLLDVASLWTLEAAYAKAGVALDAWRDARALQPPWRPATRAWLEGAAPALAVAINGAAALLDVEGIVLDGTFDRALLAALVEATTGSLDRLDWEGIVRPRLLTGTVGADARAIGGALLPIHAGFAPDRDLFLKTTPAARAPR
jgi:predicted NBD/HSP70 family sugar kinase